MIRSDECADLMAEVRAVGLMSSYFIGISHECTENDADVIWGV
jgi:hypothetical protein